MKNSFRLQIHKVVHRVTVVIRSGLVRFGPSSKKTQSGPVPGGHPRSTGTGDRDRTRSVFWTSPSVTMGVGDGVEDWNSESGEDDGDCERRDDDVDHIETTSPATDSVKSILHLPERSEDNTAWLFPEGIKSVSVLNKMKTEVMEIVRKRKEILATEVTNHGSVVDLCLRDKVNNGVCLIDFQRKAGMKNCKNFTHHEKSISGKIAPPSAAVADDPVGRTAIDDTVIDDTVGWWYWHGTTRTCRIRTCTSDDHGGRHPDLLSLICPQEDCPICATHPLESQRSHDSCDCRGEPYT